MEALGLRAIAAKVFHSAESVLSRVHDVTGDTYTTSSQPEGPASTMDC